MSTGTAKPTPSPPPPVDWICELMPITCPRAFSSGPPELPWLIAASVWIALPMRKAVSDSMSRPVAEMTPTDSDWFSPNGLPMAATGEPTTRFVDEPSCSGVSVSPAGLIFRSATSALRSVPTICAGTRLLSANWMYTSLARCSLGGSPSTTCAFVTTAPCASITKPEPSAAWPSLPVPKSEMIVTTPGASRL